MSQVGGNSGDSGRGVTHSGNVVLEDDERVYVAPGDVIAGKYRIERVLGVGGMGFVVAAKHVQLDGTFALKFLKKRFAQDERVVDRFTREAKAACRIRSEYVARVFDVGISEGLPFLVMEHLVGRDLAAVLAEQGRLGCEEAVEYTVQACAAIAAAHACGVVHRDIKPENLFLVENDGVSTVKLLDFGISRLALTGLNSEPNPSRLTGSLTLGTPFYMSPEQIRSTASADAQSDLWSLGVVLYELLTGALPFSASGVNEICAAILEKDPPSLLQLRPDAPVGLVDVVERCLQKAPALRYRSVSELAVALLGFAPPRSLAVAESSSAIRRAAIEAMGSGSETPGWATAMSLRSISLRASGSMSGPASAPGLPTPAVVGGSPSGPVAVRGGSARARALLPAVGAVALCALVATAAIHGRPAAAPVGRNAVAAALSPASTDALKAGLVKDEGPSGPATDDRAANPSGAESRALRPAVTSVRSASQPHWAPPVPSTRVSARVVAPVPKASSSASAAAPQVAVPPVSPGPPIPPGRPDLGY
jgi:eukaryotic-like serine/threonine-protein kinase